MIKHIFNTFQSVRIFLLTLLILVFPGCATLGDTGKPSASSAGFIPVQVNPAARKLAEEVPRDKLTTAARQIALKGIKSLDAENYKKANALFNLALKIDVNNSGLHFLNALAYQMRAKQGEGKLYQLADQGYKEAIHFDASNYLAHLYLGRLYLDQQQYAKAQLELMYAALHIPDDPDLLYSLAVSSYYSRDPRTAYGALQGVYQMEGNKSDARTLRALAIVAASLGKPEEAGKFLNLLGNLKGHKREQRFVGTRINDWKYDLSNSFQLVQVAGNTSPYSATYSNPYSSQLQHANGTPNTPSAPSVSGVTQNPPRNLNLANASGQGLDQGGGLSNTKMVSLDVVIISMLTDHNDTYGVNLLDGLRIQFGDSAGTPAYRATNTKKSGSGLLQTTTRNLTSLIQIPSITYSLNIANALDKRNEVLAQPSLVAIDGQKSVFFSGTDVVGAAVSTGQGGSVEVHKEAGVKLEVTPEFMPNNFIKLHINASRTFLTNPSSDVLFDFRLDTSKTTVDANVAMKYGETLILSGLSERENDSNRSGVPLLQDIPLVQYLFSNKTKRDFQKSVLILVTPRRPSYTNRNKADIKAEHARMNEFERLQNKFEGKFKHWFKPVPNDAVTRKMLNRGHFLHDFRTGDLAIENWPSRNSHAKRLHDALNFLYF